MRLVVHFPDDLDVPSAFIELLTPDWPSDMNPITDIPRKGDVLDTQHGTFDVVQVSWGLTRQTRDHLTRWTMDRDIAVFLANQ